MATLLDNTPRFVAGQQVRLKSGGPVMVVNKTSWFANDEGYDRLQCDCLWFDRNKLKSAEFPNHILVDATTN